MRISSILTFSLAIGLALLSGLWAKSWLDEQRYQAQPIVAQQTKAANGSTIVVAATGLRFGTELSVANLREIDWLTAELPEGTFVKISDILKPGVRRLALGPIEPNEPVFRWKITGPGQRASLSALIESGMKAVTIRVNDVNGIAGFVLPGDRVDLLLTRQESNNNQKRIFTEVLLQDVRVLGTDQLADEKAEKAVVVKTITVEVRMEDAQRVVLASTIGSLSLALRSAGSTSKAATSRVTPADLTGWVAPVVLDNSDVEVSESTTLGRRGLQSFGVTRSVERTEYSVPGGVQVQQERVAQKPTLTSRSRRTTSLGLLKNNGELR